MSTTSNRDEQLSALLDSIAQQARDGEQPNWQQIRIEHPELVDEVRDLWAAAMMADAVVWFEQSPPTATAQPVVREDAPELPRPFGNYTLLAELGRGGMGVVYKAHDNRLDRIVALKRILSGALAGPRERLRFRSEAEAVARLEHPAIVPIFEVGTLDGDAYFSMRYVDGETLAQRLGQGPLPARQAAEVLLQVARAVAYAHDSGVVHRDIKPANVLIDSEGSAFLSDFGLAKRTGGHISLTQSGAVLGTPNYMAPELAIGKRGTVGPPCDIYSLGAILYAMLTGRPPFQAASPVDTVLMLLEQEPLPPRLINARADRELEMITLRCLQKPPDLRYGSASELADDLQRYLEGEPIVARSGQLSQFVARVFGESHHAHVLENWGLLWMWHAAVLIVLCLITNWFQLQGMRSPIPYLVLWAGGIAVWSPILLALRARAGPVTFVERQIAHVWGGSVISVILLFIVEYLIGAEVLTLSPVLGLTNGMVFVFKAGVLAGAFYFHAAALFLTAVVMALMQRYGVDYGISLFGVVSALAFFVPGLKYYRQRRRAEGTSLRPNAER